eukprot:CAMPEP_0119121840 /NCGR_PEP_ID=MMETSP1310-20130426/2283_1 /TAXON_ID=464262 /ORGANISM="Genus nov. species nov., Strain RCC2339" /LENGTH=245 /DNA_ID=CAMNT_0007111421 /DNA_START=9 /DNA_END=746 /DNA_ORIENTATION=+
MADGMVRNLSIPLQRRKPKRTDGSGMKTSKSSENTSISQREARLLYDFACISYQGVDMFASAGERVLVDEKLDGWYRCQIVSSGKEGLIPCNYLELVQPAVTLSDEGNVVAFEIPSSSSRAGLRKDKHEDDEPSFGSSFEDELKLGNSPETPAFRAGATSSSPDASNSKILRSYRSLRKTSKRASVMGRKSSREAVDNNTINPNAHPQTSEATTTTKKMPKMFGGRRKSEPELQVRIESKKSRKS